MEFNVPITRRMGHLSSEVHGDFVRLASNGEAEEAAIGAVPVLSANKTRGDCESSRRIRR
jgi:hypothetical protein